MMLFWVLFLLSFGNIVAESDDDLLSFVTVCITQPFNLMTVS